MNCTINMTVNNLEEHEEDEMLTEIEKILESYGVTNYYIKVR